MDLLFASLPLLFVIVVMLMPRGLSAPLALSCGALLAWLVKLVWFSSSPLGVQAAVIDGIISGLTPLSIVAGAIFLFRIMQTGGALDVLRDWLNGISRQPVAQLLVIGWAFTFLIEGASGFGTPAAIAAPVLVALGFAPVQAAIFCLVCNSVPTSFGAVGTPTWFGFGALGLDDETVLAIGRRTAALHAVAALVIPLLALRLLLPWAEIRGSLGFVMISVLACVVPYVAVAQFSYEFPSLVGGAVGLALSVLAARRGWGLAQSPPAAEAEAERPTPGRWAVLQAFAPLALTIFVLVVTRIPQLGIKNLLSSSEPLSVLGLGSLGELQISRSFGWFLQDILGTAAGAGYATLYVPALIPFGLVAALSVPLLGLSWRQFADTGTATLRQLRGAAIALLAALVFVRLMMLDGDASCARLIGAGLAAVAGPVWPLAAPFLGALGSFFSGSNTVSNLTFAPIQAGIADKLQLDRAWILALQSVGGALGNMVCIHNIVAVCSVLGLSAQEGFILRRTVWPMLLYALIVGLLGLILVRAAS